MLKQAIQRWARKLKRIQHAFGREFIFSQVRLNIAPYLTEHGCPGCSARVAAQMGLPSKCCDEELGRRAYGAVRLAGTHACDVLTERRDVFDDQSRERRRTMEYTAVDGLRIRKDFLHQLARHEKREHPACLALHSNGLVHIQCKDACDRRRGVA